METFETLAHRCSSLSSVQPERADYWAGYHRGLRRAHHGEAYGTAEEHELWLSLASEEDPSRRERGIGYQEGLAALSSDVA